MTSNPPAWSSPASLAAADPEVVLSAGTLDPVTDRVYRSSVHLLRDAEPADRGQTLALEAARFGAGGGFEELGGRWAVRWATGRVVDQRLIQVLRAGGVHVELGEVDGRPLVVSDDWPGRVRVWDALTAGTVSAFEAAADARVVAVLTLGGRPLVLTGHERRDSENSFHAASGGDLLRAWDLRTGAPVGEPLAVSEGRQITVATTVVGGRDLLVTGGWDGLVRLWDLATGRQVREPMGGHEGWVVAVATAVVNGRPVAVTVGEKDYDVLVRDLTGDQVMPLVGHTDRVRAVTTAELAGRPVAVTASEDGTARVWDLADGRQIGSPLTGHGRRVSAVATAVVDGRTLLVTGGWDFTVRVWDLATGQQLGDPFTGHDQPIDRVALAVVDGRPMVVAAASGRMTRAWWLAERRLDDSRPPVAVATPAQLAVIGRQAISCDYRGAVSSWELASGPDQVTALPGHGDWVAAVTTAEVDGRTLLITAGRDQIVRVTDPAARQDALAPLTGFPAGVRSLATAELDGAVVLLLGCADGTVHLRDLASGAAPLPPLATGESAVYAMASARVDGRTVLLTGHSHHRVQRWDLARRRALGAPLTGHRRGVERIVTTVVDGRTVAITGAGYDNWMRIWDVGTGWETGPGLRGHGRGRLTGMAVLELDGRVHVVSGGDDRTVRLWDPVAHAEVAPPMPFPYRVQGLAVAGEGEVLVSFGEELALLRLHGSR